MSWLTKSYIRNSLKNGAITVYKDILSPWQISVNDCGQTTQYTHAMWVDAFKRLRKKTGTLHAPRILMLGLGAGGEIRTIHKNFPGCTLTVVEYDPAMVALAKELALYKPFPFPRVLEGDAAEVVPKINEQFDLIILDLFNGPEPSPLGQDPTFLREVQKRISQGGMLLINVYQRHEYLSAAAGIFPASLLWKFRLNNLGAFWNGHM